MLGEEYVKKESEGEGGQSSATPEPGVPLTPPLMDPDGLIKDTVLSETGKITIAYRGTDPTNINDVMTDVSIMRAVHSSSV